MIPQNATAAAVSTATTTMVVSRSRSTSTPTCRAARSPSASRSSLGARTNAAAIPTTAIGNDDADVLPPRAVQAAERPEDDLLAGLGVAEEHQERQRRTGHRVHRDAGEHQGDDLGASAVARGDVDEQGGQQAADEGADRDRPGAGEGPVEDDDGRRGDRGAGGDADDAGLGERVAEHALHQRAGGGQAGAGERGHHDPREAHLPQGVLPLRVAAASARCRGRSCASGIRAPPREARRAGRGRPRTPATSAVRRSAHRAARPGRRRRG